MTVAIVAVGIPIVAAAPGRATPSPPEPQFAPYQIVGDQAGSRRETLAVGDFTGDGRTDAVVSMSWSPDQVRDTDNTLVLLTQGSDGNLGRTATLHTDMGRDDLGRAGMAAGDLDGDGLADVALVTAQGVDVFLQRGGTLGPSQLVTAPAGHQVRIGDVDGDGHADLVVNGNDSGIWVLRGAGDGTFGAATMAGAAVWYADIALGDVTSDGRLDIVAEEPLAGAIHVYAQQVGGTFTDRAYPGRSTGGIALADLTGDGRNDVAWTNGANRPGSSIVVLAQRAQGGTLGPGVVYPSYDIPNALVSGDVNGDGRADLVTMHNGWGQAGVYPQGPDGTMGTERLLAISRGGFDAGDYRPDQLAVADVSGDGLADIVAVDSHGILLLIRGRPPLAPPTTTTTVPPITSSTTTALPVTTTTTPTTVPPPDDAVAFQVDAAHSGVSHASSLTAPLSKRWSRDLEGLVHYPLAAQGRVFALAQTAYTPWGTETTLYALDAATGADSWGPIDLGAFAQFAYGDGQVFVVNADGIVRSFDAATGRQRWIVGPPHVSTGNYTAPPVYRDGVLYYKGTEYGGSLFAIAGADGHRLWEVPITTGEAGPAAADGRVYLSGSCLPGVAYPATGGRPVWMHADGCSSGFPYVAPVVGAGLLWSRSAQPLRTAYDTGAGAPVTTFTASAPPAVDSDRGYFLSGGVLEGREPRSQETRWSFEGDGHLVSPPVAANGFVYEASSSGQVWALDAETGRVAWNGDTGAAVLPSEGMAQRGTSPGLAVGQGLLLVPASNSLVAFGQAGTSPAASPPARMAATSGAGSPSGPSVDESPGYRVDPTHQNFQKSGVEQAPFTRRWTRDLAGHATDAVIAGGRVVTVVGVTLHALDPATGSDVWDPVVLGPNPYLPGHVSFADGRIFARGGGGPLRAFDPGTGHQLWTADAQSSNGNGAPTYSQGIVHQAGAAYSAATGRRLWSVLGGDGSPVVADDVVYARGSCSEAIAFAATTGERLWQELPEYCPGNGPTMPVLARGQLWVEGQRTPVLLDPRDGKLVGASSGGAPAVDDSRAYALAGSVVRARDADTQARKWTFVGDGKMTSNPTVSGNQVSVASASGKVWALDAATGNPVWSDDLGVEVWPDTTISAGQGLMVVPTATGLVAYEPVATPPPAPAPAQLAGSGWNGFGQLGTGTTDDRHEPATVNGLSDVVQTAAGAFHTLALRTDGTVWAWGWNGVGQLGDGTTVDRHSPVRIPGLSDVMALGAGADHSLAATRDGAVWAWGWNVLGQLGDGTTVDRHSPIRVPGLAGVVNVAGGLAHSLAVGADGTARAWGWNNFGQLGDGTTTNRSSPVRVSGLTGAARVGAGVYHSVAMKKDGTVAAWGWNGVGAVGDGTITERHTPVAVGGLANVVAIGAGAFHSVAVLDDGTVRTWGWNGQGQLGDGTTTDRHAPVAVGGLRGVTTVGVGWCTVLARRGDATVMGWGWNANGQLGDGTTTDRSAPVLTGTRGVTAVSSGYAHSLTS